MGINRLEELRCKVQCVIENQVRWGSELENPVRTEGECDVILRDSFKGDDLRELRKPACHNEDVSMPFFAFVSGPNTSMATLSSGLVAGKSRK